MTSPAFPPSAPLAVRGLTVRYGPVVALRDVTLAVPRGAVYALLGPAGAGKSSLARCLLGRQRPTAGEATLFGRNARRICVAKLLRRFGVPSGIPPSELPQGEDSLPQLDLALGSRPEALVLDEPTAGLDRAAARAFLEELARERRRGTTLLLLTSDPALAEGIATHVGILREGRLVLDEELENLKLRFRRIRYSNELAEERTEYGTELDAFDAVRVKVRGWGVEAVVSNFDDGAFAAFAAMAGVVDAEAEALSLEEIFVAVVGEGSPPAGP